MTYSKQTFTLNQKLTSAQVNQLETNIQDHVHGSGSMSDIPGIQKIATGSSTAVATLDITQTDSAKWKHYLLVIHNVAPATDAVSLFLRTSTDGGSTFAADAVYSLAGTDVDNNVPTLTTRGGAGATALTLGLAASHGNAANEIGCGEIWILNPHDANTRTRILWQYSWIDTGGMYHTDQSSGHHGANENTNAFRLLFGSGNIASIKWTLYGVPGEA